MSRLVLLGAAVLLSGCTADSSTAAPTAPLTPVETVGVQAEHNSQDIAFAQDLLAVQQQGSELGALAEDRGNSRTVRELGRDLAESRDQSVPALTAMLTAWGAVLPGGMEGAPEATASDDEVASAPRLLSPNRMAELQAVTDDEFDEALLRALVTHHESALDVAAQELERGDNDQARDLAETLVGERTEALDQVQQLLPAP